MDVSENSDTPKSSILIGFSIINYPFWGSPIFGNIHISLTNDPTMNWVTGTSGGPISGAIFGPYTYNWYLGPLCVGNWNGRFYPQWRAANMVVTTITPKTHGEMMGFIP